MSGGGTAAAAAPIRVPVSVGGVAPRVWWLLAPLVLFQAVLFVLPILYMFHNAFHEPNVVRGLPNASALLGRATALPPGDEVFRALATDLAEAQRRREDSLILKPVRHQSAETWTMMRGLLAVGPDALASMSADDFLALDPRWGEAVPWRVLQRLSDGYTAHYFLAALDLEFGADGAVRRKAAEQRVYLPVLATTLEISFTVTVLTALLGYPVAYYMTVSPARTRAVVLFLVLLPFWSSLLVRTYAWIAILQRDGVVNKALLGLGAIADPLKMVHNRLGLTVAMVHVLLPLMILPLYSVMRRISQDSVRAAESLGASRTRAFAGVYIPQTVPGLMAGATLVFATSLGYYITPVLIGGAGEAMTSSLIAININQVVNWGLASALAIVLVATAISIFIAGLLLSGRIARRMMG